MSPQLVERLRAAAAAADAASAAYVSTLVMYGDGAAARQDIVSARASFFQALLDLLENVTTALEESVDG